MSLSVGFKIFGCRSRDNNSDNPHHAAPPDPAELDQDVNVTYRPASRPVGESDGDSQADEAATQSVQLQEPQTRREHEEQVYHRGYTHPFSTRWQQSRSASLQPDGRRPSTVRGVDRVNQDGGILFADGSRVRRVGAGEEKREETEEESQARRENEELLAKAKKHWEELKILQAMLMTTPCLRVKTGTELADSKTAFTNGDDCCSICLEDFDPELKYREMPCGHIFHIDCVDSWLEKRTTCPVCKGSVIEKCSTLDQMAAKETVRINTENHMRRHELNTNGSAAAAGTPCETQASVCTASGCSAMPQSSAPSTASRRYLAYV